MNEDLVRFWFVKIKMDRGRRHGQKIKIDFDFFSHA